MFIPRKLYSQKRQTSPQHGKETFCFRAALPDTQLWGSHSTSSLQPKAQRRPLPSYPCSEGLILSLRHVLIRRHILPMHLLKSNCTLRKNCVCSVCLLSFSHGHHRKCHLKCMHQEQAVPLICTTPRCTSDAGIK